MIAAWTLRCWRRHCRRWVFWICGESSLATITDRVCGPGERGRLPRQRDPRRGRRSRLRGGASVRSRRPAGHRPAGRRRAHGPRPGRRAHRDGSAATLRSAALAAFPPLEDLTAVAHTVGVPGAWLSEATPDGPRQPLHGDFSCQNIRVAGSSWRLFDFDDCGYGAVELDLANSLYFALFDAMTGPDLDHHHDQRFRESFLG
ncbi:MAG TPA: phosphotransferase, partial [Acidimicrobiales bacterium]